MFAVFENGIQLFLPKVSNDILHYAMLHCSIGYQAVRIADRFSYAIGEKSGWLYSDELDLSIAKLTVESLDVEFIGPKDSGRCRFNGKLTDVEFLLNTINSEGVFLGNADVSDLIVASTMINIMLDRTSSYSSDNPIVIARAIHSDIRDKDFDLAWDKDGNIFKGKFNAQAIGSPNLGFINFFPEQRGVDASLTISGENAWLVDRLNTGQVVTIGKIVKDIPTKSDKLS
jgi:hypothetical protein